jgi:hypothetical protein
VFEGTAAQALWLSRFVWTLGAWAVQACLHNTLSFHLISCVNVYNSLDIRLFICKAGIYTIFHYCDKYLRNQLEKTNSYICSWLQRFQSMVGWLQMGPWQSRSITVERLGRASCSLCITERGLRQVPFKGLPPVASFLESGPTAFLPPNNNVIILSLPKGLIH